MDDNTRLEEENKRLKAQLHNMERKKKEKWTKRYRWSKKLSAKFLGAKLKNAIHNFFTELQEKKTVSREVVSDLLAALFIRITRIGIFLLITSLLPTLLILLQVYYLKNQNRLITGQNERMKQQTFLQEADRRGYMMGILDKIINEVTAQGGLHGAKRSANTTRLIAISKILKPYRYLNNDQLIPKPLSPERGYLLLSLLESNIELNAIVDRNTQKSLISALNFEYAELKDASVTALNLENINFNYSDLRRSNFMKSILSGKGKYNEYSTIMHANLQQTIFDRCDLTRCDFSYSNLKDSSFANSSLTSVNFKEANLEHSDFNNCDLTQINFTNANIFKANFDNASVEPNFMKIMKDQLPRKSFNYLEDTYELKIRQKRGLLIRKKIN